MGENEKELTREQLKNVVDQLQQQNKFLINELQKRGNEDLYKRIDYLFKVLDNKEVFINADSSFYDDCITDLISILKIDKPSETPVEK